MLLWLTFAVLTAIALAAVLAPLVREDESVEVPASAADMAVYRDQLREVEAEVERGLISAGEAEAAKTEVSRRLLQHAGDAASGANAAGRPTSARKAFYSALVLIPTVALALYLWVGSPNLPGRPYAAPETAPKADQNIETLIAQVEEALRKNPRDGRGWDALAPVYLRLGRAVEAAHAFTRAIDLLGETPQRLAGYAESEVIASKGVVTEKARKAFSRLEKLAPGRPVVRYWLAVAKEQDGKLEAAAADYTALLKDAKAESPWRHIVEKQLASLQAKRGGEKPAPLAPSTAEERGRSAAGMAAVLKMAPHDQAQFMKQRIADLADRLKTEGDDLPGWMRLVRSYSVLGRKSEALKALANARKQFSGNSRALGDLNALAKRFDLGS